MNDKVIKWGTKEDIADAIIEMSKDIVTDDDTETMYNSLIEFLSIAEEVLTEKDT